MTLYETPTGSKGTETQTCGIDMYYLFSFKSHTRQGSVCMKPISAQSAPICKYLNFFPPLDWAGLTSTLLLSLAPWTNYIPRRPVTEQNERHQVRLCLT